MKGLPDLILCLIEGSQQLVGLLLDGLRPLDEGVGQRRHLLGTLLGDPVGAHPRLLQIAPRLGLRVIDDARGGLLGGLDDRLDPGRGRGNGPL
jgi:hypothetical protein